MDSTDTPRFWNSLTDIRNCKIVSEEKSSNINIAALKVTHNVSICLQGLPAALQRSLELPEYGLVQRMIQMRHVSMLTQFELKRDI